VLSKYILKHTNIKILAVVLHECQIYYLGFRETPRFRVFNGKMLRRMYYPKIERIIAGKGESYIMNRYYHGDE
jgi:hypothetical protein